MGNKAQKEEGITLYHDLPRKIFFSKNIFHNFCNPYIPQICPNLVVSLFGIQECIQEWYSRMG